MFEESEHAKVYSIFRPNPPKSLIETIISYSEKKAPLELALDVGCGSGQSTRILAPYAKRVIGSDISKSQIDEANQVL